MTLNGVSASDFRPDSKAEVSTIQCFFSFDLSQEDISLGYLQWGPTITQSLGAMNDSSVYSPHTWLSATYSDEWADHLEFSSFSLNWIQKPGSYEKVKAKAQPPRGVWKCQAIYLLSFPMGPCPHPLRLPYQYVLTKHLGNGASASPRRWFQRPRPR